MKNNPGDLCSLASLVTGCPLDLISWLLLYNTLNFANLKDICNT